MGQNDMEQDSPVPVLERQNPAKLADIPPQTHLNQLIIRLGELGCIIFLCIKIIIMSWVEL